MSRFQSWQKNSKKSAFRSKAKSCSIAFFGRRFSFLIKNLPLKGKFDKIFLVPHITNLTRRKIPKISWKKIKEKVLGKKYCLSLVFAGNSLMEKLNVKYRKKNRPAAVLSFPLSENNGEIFINLSQKRYSPLYLFIHGLLHLKGFKHSAKMKEQEQWLMREYEKRHCHRS